MSFVFTDAPFHLSEFIFDGVVCWDGKEFCRIERPDLPSSFQEKLQAVVDDVRTAILISVGDAVARLGAKYGHQLLSGQAYLTLEALSVMNIRGNCGYEATGLEETLPYATTILMNWIAQEIADASPESNQVDGALSIPSWISGNLDKSRVSEAHLKEVFEKYGSKKIDCFDDGMFRLLDRLLERQVEASKA